MLFLFILSSFISFILFYFNSKYLLYSLDALLSGLDLFMNRCIKYQNEIEDNNSSNIIFKNLYLCKLYIISDWISKKLASIHRIPNFNNSVLEIMRGTNKK